MSAREMAALPNAPCRTALSGPGETSETAVLHLIPAGCAKNAPGGYATTYSCVWVAARVVGDPAAGVGNACSLNFERPRALGDRRGASALVQLSRCGMTNASSQKWGCGDRIMMGA
jgi:hypothetical protein